MQTKETLGEYINQKRTELGLTQKQIAEKLFVTESAVSKWERGVSYPDITLIREICEILQISEHELLTASEDVKTRNYEKQAKKYTRLINRYKYGLLFIYGLTLLTCLIVNIAVQHTVSWFFIVFGSILVAFSITILPVLVDKHKAIITLGGFTFSLLLLLLITSIYTGGDWFLMATISIVFGFSIVFLPFVLKTIPLPGFLLNQKTLIYFIVNSVLLFLLLLTENSYSERTTFLSKTAPVTGILLILPWAFMIIIRYAKINGMFKTSACLGITGVYFFYIEPLLNRFLDEKSNNITFDFDFSNWSNDVMINNNVHAIIMISLIVLMVAFAIAGIIIEVRRKKDKKIKHSSQQ